MDQLLKNFLKYVVTIFLAVSIIFILIRLAPGDPVERILGPEASYEEVQKYRSQLGLDRSFFTQYIDYMKKLITLNLGESLFKKKKVFFLIGQYFSPSLILAILSVSLSFIIGSFWGVVLAVNKGKALDNIIRVVSLFGLSFPIFSLAPMLVLVFSIKLGILPVSEWGELRHIVLPVLTLTIPLSAILIRVTRSRFLEDLSEPWVQVLISKGLRKRSVLFRVFKATLPSVLNVVAVQLSVVLAGTIVTETIYDIPGMGLLLFDGIQNRDYPLVQGMIVVITIIYLSVYFIIESINNVIDPRIVK